LRRALFDEWQILSPRKIDADKVAVVLIDRESLAAVGPWPWPRYYLARLAETIAAQKPRAIAFDMIFPEADRLNPDRFTALYPELDSSSAAAIAALPRPGHRRPAGGSRHGKNHDSRCRTVLPGP